MSTEKIREEFEAEWGYSNEEQGLKFIPELNVYGCDLYDNADIASSKSSAWYYWQASRAVIEVELSPYIHADRNMVIEAIESIGLKVKP